MILYLFSNNATNQNICAQAHQNNTPQTRLDCNQTKIQTILFISVSSPIESRFYIFSHKQLFRSFIFKNRHHISGLSFTTLVLCKTSSTFYGFPLLGDLTYLVIHLYRKTIVPAFCHSGDLPIVVGLSCKRQLQIIINIGKEPQE